MRRVLWVLGLAVLGVVFGFVLRLVWPHSTSAEHRTR